MKETARIVRFARALAHMLLLGGCCGALASCNSSTATWPQPAQAAPSSRTPSPGVDAGAPTPLMPQGEKKKASPKPPKLPYSSRLVCKADRDCVFVGPRPCMCDECGTSWREVLNRQAVKKLKAFWAVRRCVARPCPKCESRLLGTKAVCRAGQCTVE